jgi:hypothetical protein
MKNQSRFLEKKQKKEKTKYNTDKPSVLQKCSKPLMEKKHLHNFAGEKIFHFANSKMPIPSRNAGR